MSLKIVTNPAIEPVSLTEAKQQLNLPNDSTHDAKLDRLVSAARRDVERHTRRALTTQTWRLRFPRFNTWRISLPRPPLQSVSSIVYENSNGDTTTLSSSLYQVDTDSAPGFVEPAVNEVWPDTELGNNNAVTITYVAGYGDAASSVPAEFRQLILELVCFRFYHGGDLNTPIPDHIKWSLDALRCGAMFDYYGVKS